MRLPTPLHALLRRAAGAAAILAGPLAAAAASAQPNGWTPCAQEGGVCNVAAPTMLRFGADGRYAFRYAREPLPCTVAAFGSDPAPGLVKGCEAAPNWRGMQRSRGWRDAGAAGGAAQPWRVCAEEGAVCTLGAAQAVRFGADGRYVTRQLSGSFRCDTATFGDPAPGVPKSCEIADDSEWLLCANEGDTCRVPGPTRVRYGAEGRYVERQASQSVACHNGIFGDPLPGVPKQCEYRRLEGTGTAAAVVDAGLPWRACAREGERCRFNGGAMLRYGAGGRHAYLEAVGGVVCGNEAFGGDPAPGQAKRCEILRLR